MLGDRDGLRQVVDNLLANVPCARVAAGALTEAHGGGAAAASPVGFGAVFTVELSLAAELR